MEYNMMSVKKKFPIQLILNRFAISEQGMWRFYVLSHGIIRCSDTFSSLSNKPKIPGEPLTRMVHLIKNEQVTTSRSLPLL